MLESKEVQLASTLDAGNIIRIIVVLVLIIVAAYFLTRYIAKRSLRQGMRDRPRSRRSASSQQRMKPEFGHMVAVVDRIPVDRDKTLMVVEFEGKYYLIGTTPDGFQCIDQVEMADVPESEREEEPDAEAAESAPGAPERPPDEATFGQRFRKAFGIVLQSYLPKGMRKETAESPSFDQQLKARLRRQDDADSGSDTTDSSD